MRALYFLMHLGPLDKPFESYSFTKVPDCPQTLTRNTLWSQEKGAQIGVSE